MYVCRKASRTVARARSRGIIFARPKGGRNKLGRCPTAHAVPNRPQPLSGKRRLSQMNNVRGDADSDSFSKRTRAAVRLRAHAFRSHFDRADHVRRGAQAARVIVARPVGGWAAASSATVPPPPPPPSEPRGRRPSLRGGRRTGVPCPRLVLEADEVGVCPIPVAGLDSEKAARSSRTNAGHSSPLSNCG